MHLVKRLGVCFLAGFLALGCGDSGFVKARGRVIKGGEPFLADEGEGMRIVFVPLEASGTKYDTYAAAYDPYDGSFFVMGKQDKGLPPGKYRVSNELIKKKEDLLNGKLMGAKSPLTLEVTKNSKDLVIDLDQANFDKLLANAAAKPAKRGSAKRN